MPKMPPMPVHGMTPEARARVARGECPQCDRPVEFETIYEGEGVRAVKCPLCTSGFVMLLGQPKLKPRFTGLPTTGVICEHCGSDPSQMSDSTWRCAGDHWEHRCADVHPQVGHWRVDPKS